MTPAPTGGRTWPGAFLEHIWSGRRADGTKLKPKGKTVGFKSFPNHWRDACNEDVCRNEIRDDPAIKKILLSRECELSTYVSMKRAEITGSYLTLPYPTGLKVTIDVAAFQVFVNNYRFTFQRNYRSPLRCQEDTFRVTYEQLTDDGRRRPLRCLHRPGGTWSILLPICSRVLSMDLTVVPYESGGVGCNRFARVEASSRHRPEKTERPETCWNRLRRFSDSFADTTSARDREAVEILVGIDEDDGVFDSEAARERIAGMLPCTVRFVTIGPNLFGRVCRIWSHLAGRAEGDFIVLLGDDVELRRSGPCFRGSS